MYKRLVAEYDPREDAKARWPGWRFETVSLSGAAEVIRVDDMVVMIDPRAWPEGEQFAFAHALVHLDYGHHEEPGSTLTHDQEIIADLVAGIRLM